MPTRSGKSFSVAEEPQPVADPTSVTSTRLPVRARRLPPTNASPHQPTPRPESPKVRKRKKRTHGSLANMRRHLIDLTPANTLEQVDFDNRSQYNIGRDPTSKEDENNIHVQVTTNSNEQCTSPQNSPSDGHAAVQVSAKGQTNREARIQRMQQKRKENEEKRERKKARREEKQAQVAARENIVSIMFSLEDAKEYLACDAHFTPSYDLQIGEHIAWPVVRSYHLGAMGRFGVDAAE